MSVVVLKHRQSPFERGAGHEHRPHPVVDQTVPDTLRSAAGQRFNHHAGALQLAHPLRLLAGPKEWALRDLPLDERLAAADIVVKRRQRRLSKFGVRDKGQAEGGLESQNSQQSAGADGEEHLFRL